MNVTVGLVGLPNAGKSTLFNALTKSAVSAENYPFCTIDPHSALTIVPDERLQQLYTIYQSKKIIPPLLTFVDIAGIVKGASKGEGLGNQFLSHIRSVDLILYVVRAFEDSSIIHVEGSVNPQRDFETAQLELAFKDKESADTRLEKIKTLLKKQMTIAEREALEKEEMLLKEFSEKIGTLSLEEAAVVARNKELASLNFLIAKPYCIVANFKENDFEKGIAHHAHWGTLASFFSKKNIPIIPTSVKIEYELSLLPEEEKAFYEQELSYQSSLPMIIRKSYDALSLISFFTCGKNEIHAWTITKGISIREAAGTIHSDLEKGFISATVIKSEDIIEKKSEQKIKESGLMRTVGASYIVEDGDIIHVLFNT